LANTAIALDWPAVAPVLDAFCEGYTAAGAPEHGIETEAVLGEAENSGAARAATGDLVHGGYLEAVTDVDQSDVPITVRPTLITLRLLAGWPGGTAEAALDELVRAPNKAIDGAESDEDRSKLVRVRDGLLRAARDIALAYFEKKIGA
jgi:hypothetical protein